MILVGKGRWASGPDKGNPWRPFMVTERSTTHFLLGQHITTTMLDVYVRWEDGPKVYGDFAAEIAATKYYEFVNALQPPEDDDPGEYTKLDRSDG